MEQAIIYIPRYGVVVEEKGEDMESTVAALLLVTSTVVLACIVVVYSVDTILQSFSADSLPNQLINSIQNQILNQTSIFNSTWPGIQNVSP
jgi:hypothetical protein